MNIANDRLFHRISWLVIFSSLLASFEGGSSEYDDYRNTWNNKCVEFHSKWKGESDSAKRSALSHDLVDAAVRADCSSLVEEVAADGRLVEKEIVISKNSERLVLRPIRALNEIWYMSEDYNDQFIVRRITAKAFEVWTNKKGWLFDAKGSLLNEVVPLRHDGRGREWYGAFLPDGRWATTDLWDFDRTFTIFARDGKCLKEIPFGNLVDWARSDSKGSGWVLSVGSECDRVISWIPSDFSSVVSLK